MDFDSRLHSPHSVSDLIASPLPFLRPHAPREARPSNLSAAGWIAVSVTLGRRTVVYPRVVMLAAMSIAALHDSGVWPGRPSARPRVRRNRTPDGPPPTPRSSWTSIGR